MKNQPNAFRIKWQDSTSVRNFIKEASLCKEIQMIRDSAEIFVEHKGYSGKILESVSRQVHKRIYIAISRGGSTVLTFKEQVKDLRLQMEDLQNELCKEE